MKTITIGRDPGCNIFVDDKMISRRHALLRIHSTGKMELVDMSSNGTFVNGVKLASNVPFPVSRKDSVSFAHMKQLDWALVPNPFAWVKWVCIGLAALIIIIGVLVGINQCSGSTESRTTDTPDAAVESTSNPADTEKPKTEETVGQSEKADAESETRSSSSWYQKEINKHRAESVKSTPRQHVKADAKDKPAQSKPNPKADGKQENKPAEQPKPAENTPKENVIL